MSSAGVVHIVDDDESLRLALVRLFRSVGIEARPYGSVDEFQNREKINAPECLVLDVRLPGTNGLELQEQLIRLGVHLPVILMTGHGDIQMSVRGMKAGAIDFLTKPFRDQDMLDAVTVAIKTDQKRRAVDAELLDLRQRYATLTPREQEVMLLVATGKMNKQVAGELDISEVTVKIHRGAVMRKMQARTLPDLVLMVDALKAIGPTETPNTYV
jgi:FixJ family two-component response regulator